MGKIIRWFMMLAVVMFISCITVRNLSASPQPGEVYREWCSASTVTYANTGDWRVTSPTADSVKNPAVLADLPNEPQVITLTAADLVGVQRAELIINRWNGHPGTVNKQININGNAWIAVPNTNINTANLTECSGNPESYMLQDIVEINLTAAQLTPGMNAINFTCGNNTGCGGFSSWGQWGTNGAILRLYYTPSAVPAPSGNITGPSTNGTIAETAAISVNAIPPSGASITNVDYVAYYDGYDENGDNYFLDWHEWWFRKLENNYQRITSTTYTDLKLSNHVGSATASPWGVTWNTKYIPDQGSVKLKARIKASNGYWYVTPEITNLTVSHSANGYTTVIYKPGSIPSCWGQRTTGTKYCNITIPAAQPSGLHDLTKTLECAMYWKTWSSDNATFTINNNVATTVQTTFDNYQWVLSLRPVAATLLSNSQMAIRVVNTTVEHGTEVLLPGPVLLVRYNTSGMSMVATPTFSPASGTVPQTVTVTCATSGAEIRYTTNGTDPTSASTLYTTAISITSACTLKAKAFKTGMIDSATGSATYTALQVATPTISPTSGTVPVTVTISCTESGAEIRYTTDGSDPTSASTLYTSQLNITSACTLKAKAFKTGMSNSATASATYTTQNTGSLVKATFSEEIVMANTPQSTIAPSNPAAKTFADIDGDGKLDLIVSGDDANYGGIYWFDNNGGPASTWAKKPIAGPGIFGVGTYAADVDGDGDMDIVAGWYGSTTVEVRWYENTGNYAANWPMRTVGTVLNNSHDKKVVDLDGDGKMEIINRGEDFRNKGVTEGNGNYIYIFHQGASITAAWTGIKIPCLYGEGLQVKDVTGDGMADIVIAGCYYKNPYPNSVMTVANWTQKYYGTQSEFPTSTGYKVAVGDINMDGRPDIVLSASENDFNYDGVPDNTTYNCMFAWYEAPSNPVTGTWTKHLIEPGAQFNLHSLQIADFNKDGLPDIATSKMHNSIPSGVSGVGDVMVYYQYPKGTFNPANKQVISTMGTHEIQAADFDNDGDIDLFGANWRNIGTIVVDSEGADIKLWRNTMTTKLALNDFTYKQVDNNRERYFCTTAESTGGGSGTKYFGTDAADFTGDGYKDIVSGKYFYKNPGTDMIGTWTRTTFPVNVDGCLAVDVDADGVPEVIAEGLFQSDASHVGGTADPGVYLLKKTGNTDTTADWTATKIIDDTVLGSTLHGNGQGYLVADIVRGGKPEILLEGNAAIYCVEIPNSNYTTPASWITKEIAACNEQGFAVGDINKDGLLDVVVGDYTNLANGIYWCKNPGAGADGHVQPIANWTRNAIGNTQQTGTGVSTRYTTDRIKVADINNDGRLDVVVSNEYYQGGVWPSDVKTFWFEQTAAGGWTQHVICSGQYSSNSMDVADIDLDGQIEVVTGEMGDGANANNGKHVRIWDTTDNGATWTATTAGTAESHCGAMLYDMDNDGDLDILSNTWGPNGTYVGYESYKNYHLWRNNAIGIGGGTPSNLPPTASITVPTSGQNYPVAPASVSITATASDPDDTISKVIISGDATPLTTISGALASYTYTWTGVPAGNHSISVTAYDSYSTPSSPVTRSISVGSVSTSAEPRFKVKETIGSGSFSREDKPVELSINFTSLLANSNIGITGLAFNVDSLRVKEVDGSNNVINPNVPFQFDQATGYNAVTNASGNLTLIMAGNTAANTDRYYEVYFDTNPLVSAVSVPAQVAVTDVANYAGQDSLKIVTVNADYYYHKTGGAFASIIDKNSNDWVSFHHTTGSGAGGEYRGLPNIGPCAHPGYPEMSTTGLGATTTVLVSGPIKTTVKSITTDNNWEWTWDFYPKYATMTLSKKDSTKNYWFLYEGTPGGGDCVNSTDYFYRSNDTTQKNCGSYTNSSSATNLAEDIPNPEWVYFADSTLNRSLYLVNQEDDSYNDNYWSMTAVATNYKMTVWGFGRAASGSGNNTLMTTVPAHLTIGLADSRDKATTANTIESSWRQLGAITQSAPEVTVPGPSNQAPTASITAPSNAASYNLGDTVTINATATDSDGTISKVDFYAGVTLVGTDTTLPYSCTWTPTVAGSYNLTAVATDDGNATGTSSVIAITVNSAGPIQQAYPAGVDWAIGSGTTTIQVEDYDMMTSGKGEGTAYHDTTVGNSSTVYRTSENVDVQACTDTGGGYNVGWTKPGEWLEYSVNVNEGGEYKIILRAAMSGSASPLHLEFGTHNLTPYCITPSVTIPNTGGWQTWTDVTLSTGVTLTAGNQIMKLVMDASAITGCGNLNYISLIKMSADTPNVVATPTISPAAGSYADSVTVTLGCATNAAEIRYTTNGTDPTSSSTLYNSPFTLTASATVRARAFKATMTDSSVNSTVYTITTVSNQQSYGNTPVGTPWQVGAGSTTVQAENYDTVITGSASGETYFDTTAGNTGGAYRTTENVDIQACTDTGGGYSLGYVYPTEWLEYSINVNQSGDYKVIIRAANGQASAGSPIHIEFGPHNATTLLTPAVSVPATGGWQTWTDVVVSTDIALAAGDQIMKLVMNSGAGSAGNFNYITLVRLSADTTPPTISAVTTPSITGSGIVITWTTNELATSKVEYGLTTSYGSETPVTDTDGVYNHSVTLSGLTENTVYHYRMVSVDMNGNPTTTGDYSFTTISNDPNPPVISNVTAGVTQNSAVITWTTDENSDSQIAYGLTTDLVNTTTLDATPTRLHSVLLSALDKGKTYYYKVYSRDSSNNLAISAQYSFKTYNLKHRIYTYYYDDGTTATKTGASATATLKFKVQVYNVDENSIATDYTGTLTLTTKNSNSSVLDAANSTLTLADSGEKEVSIPFRSDINTVELTGDTTAPVVINFNDMYIAKLVGYQGGSIRGANGLKIIIPTGVLSANKYLASIKTSAAPAVQNTIKYVNTKNPICYDFGELTFNNNAPVLQNQVFTRAVNITIPYAAADIGTLNEDGLRIYYWTGTDWDLVSGVQTVDKVNNTITATVKHFSTYRILGSYVSVDMSNVKVYPNPFNPDTAVLGKLKIINLPMNSNMKLYTVAGRLVRELKEVDFGNLGWLEWDGKNDDGDKVARGVYIYQLEDAAGNKKTGKIGLVK
ncbi:MAG: chitobiase/beta-hexosaminidase C-terminal domain-containing protein [Elusimicrobia bacterium]|nr:chitobiase/beta-hexosaminidase C-terminal domain-containing protein [Elusimicrobiota bacterium]